MRIGVDVGGTNTDAVLMDGSTVAAWTKQPTSAGVSEGVAAAIGTVLGNGGVDPSLVSSVMIGTTHFANALVERDRLDAVGIIRLASPSGEALPPLTGWPDDLAARIGSHCYLLRGGYEVDGREISPLDEAGLRDAARALRKLGVQAVAITSAFAPINAAMEERAARIVQQEHPSAIISLSSAIGRLGIVERENGGILNAALSSLAKKTIASFERALRDIGLDVPLFISQNDGTLISAGRAAQYPVLTIGSGPTNSMRGAAFLTGLRDAMVMDVGGTTCDIGVLANGFPRESSIAVDIGGIRTNFRMPDVLSIGLGGGTRVHLDPALYQAAELADAAFAVGPDSVGFRINQDAMLFGGTTLTASDIAAAFGRADFGDPTRLPRFSPGVIQSVWTRFQAMLEDGLDRMKTERGDTTIIAVGGGSFLIDPSLKGAREVVRPPHAQVANAVGAAIAQVGAQAEQIVDYAAVPREQALELLRNDAIGQVIAAGGSPTSVEIVDIEEVFLSYLPGRSAQIRARAVGDLGQGQIVRAESSPLSKAELRHAH